MPIAVKDYTWEETDTAVNIVVPLKGVKASKVDIFSTEEYLKVNYPPYFFEILLNAQVDDSKSKAKVGNGAVTFDLVKKETGVWSQLQSSDFGNKEVMKIKREEAIQKAQERSEQEAKESAEKKREAEKYALKEQMRLDDEERKRIEEEKATERKKATDDLEKWKEEQIKAAQEEKKRLEEEHTEKEKERQEAEKQQQKDKAPVKRKGKKPSYIFEEDAKGTSVRQSATINVKFSHREFPTAARESQSEQENEWLRKQAEARRIIELESKEYTEQERNPQWLLNKGNSFFKDENYQSAINAFTHAIRMDSKMPALFSNRSACHLKLRNYFKCIEDSSKALDLLTPPVQQNAASRCKAHIRRGTAFCQIELYAEGLQDYEAALKIDPHNEQIKADAERIRKVVQSSTGT